MKTPVPLFVLIFISMACITPKDVARKSVYSFSIDNKEYQIASINTKSGEGVNYLTGTDNFGSAILKARDLNQDGTIDIILKGSISLKEANRIYTMGINSARAEGNYEERVSLRTFEFIIDETLYTIKTYILDSKNATNLFIIYSPTIHEEFILSDSNADGELDSIENGSLTIEEANKLYKLILYEGVRSRRIYKTKNKFLVQENISMKSASFYKN